MQEILILEFHQEPDLREKLAQILEFSETNVGIHVKHFTDAESFETFPARADLHIDLVLLVSSFLV